MSVIIKYGWRWQIIIGHTRLSKRDSVGDTTSLKKGAA